MRGGRWRDHREVIDATAFEFQTGKRWVRLPEKYGNWRGVYNRLRMWAVDGTWERVFTALMAQADTDEDLLKGFRGIATRYEKTATLRSSGHPRVFPALGKIRLKTDPGAVRLHNGRSLRHRSVQGFQASTH
ncbi:transposase [Streptomyces rapamycinicus]|uniref:transposase n=1 Tax=Streptomyces rapamycinicus TaxID=1226757 RepID=UPI00220E1779|nr:transposase [Streptomyces rapamycinicus]UTP28278.1 transposase [Streptomyces rapamycinicus NRRL 5491]